MIESNKDLVHKLVELYSTGNLKIADEIIHPETENHSGGEMWSDGPESVKRFVAAVRKSSPDFKRTVHDIVAEGDKVVLFSTVEGTHTGEGGNIPFPPTGETLRMTGVATFQIRDGKIVGEPWSNWDYDQLFDPVHKRFAQRWFEHGWNSRNPDVIDEYFHADYVGHIYGGYAGRTGQGRDAVRSLFTNMWEAFPDLEVSLEDQLVDGNKVSNRLVMSGTPTREFFGYMPTGKQVRREGVMTFKIGEGQFVEGWATWGPFVEA